MTNKTEEDIKKSVETKVYNSAVELLEKHKGEKVLVCDDQHGRYKTYSKPVAEALLLKKRATRPKKYFFMKG
jgi:hypothetical protein